MNESINDIKGFIQLLGNEEVISFLERTVEENVEGKIFLVFPKLSYRQKDLHLHIVDNKKVSFIQEGELTGTIQTKLGYDHTSDDIGNKIEITYRSNLREGGEKEFIEMLPLTLGNLKNGNIEQFFSRNYPHATPSVRLKTTERKNSDEENVVRAQRIVALLKSDSKLWETFTQNPNSWEEDQKKVGEAIKKESPTARDYSSGKK